MCFYDIAIFNILLIHHGKNFKSTRVVCVAAIVLLSSCHAGKNAPINVLANNNKDRDALEEFALCRCLYEVGKYTNEEREEDGSVAPYVEFSSLGIEKIEEADAL